MAGVPSKFSQGEITREVKGVVAAGVDMMRVEADTNADIVIAGKPSNAAAGDTPEDLKNLV
jgi:hypothetical protein